jgi:acetyltransferase-like isoleucine patch superfamily enzyme
MRNKAGHYLKRLITSPFGVIRSFICRTRSLYYSLYIDEGSGKITISDPWLRIKIRKSKGARLIINGNFRITTHLCGTSPVRILLSNNSKLQIDGDFVIGQGVRIYLRDGAELYFGGKREQSDSGITSDTLIMVYNKIRIGFDFICAWNVFISDSDWHQIKEQELHSDIDIGNHVWIANNCSILKGSRIGEGSIVASHSKVNKKEYPLRSLIAGIPALVVRSNVSWDRDIMENS